MAKSQGMGEYEHHIVGIRQRIIGSGNFRITLEGLQAVQSIPLVPLVMASVTRFEPTTLANFQSQRTRMVGKVQDINEWFEISRILIWAKPVAAEYPQ